MNIFFLGPQGSGKSTQAKLLSEHLNLPLVSVGDLLRKRALVSDDVGKTLSEVMNKGELVDDDLVDQLVEEELTSPRYSKGFIADGFPRTKEQARKFSFSPDLVIYLNTSDKVGIERLLKRGRQDDTPEAIAERLSIYHQETEPLLAYYKKEGILKIVNGERTVEEIFEGIKDKIKDWEKSDDIGKN